jgi:hypothetical protein
MSFLPPPERDETSDLQEALDQSPTWSEASQTACACRVDRRPSDVNGYGGGVAGTGIRTLGVQIGERDGAADSRPIVRSTA